MACLSSNYIHTGRAGNVILAISRKTVRRASVLTSYNKVHVRLKIY